MPKKLDNISRLQVHYLRMALNNPRWTTELQDYIDGCDILRLLPVQKLPSTTDDAEALAWGADIALPSLELTEDHFETVRKASKWAIENKLFPVNEQTVGLIRLFALKSAKS